MHPFPNNKTKPSVFSPIIIIIPTIPLHLIILCSPSPCLLCPSFCKSHSFFMLSSLNSTTTTNTDLYLYFLPPTPVFIEAPFASPLIHKTNPSPSWRENRGGGAVISKTRDRWGRWWSLAFTKMESCLHWTASAVSQETSGDFMAENEKSRCLKTRTAGEKGNRDVVMDFRQDENGNLENSPWKCNMLNSWSQLFESPRCQK